MAVDLACMVDSRHPGGWGKGWIQGGSEEWEPDLETKNLASMEYYSAYTSTPVPRSEGTLALRFFRSFLTINQYQGETVRLMEGVTKVFVTCSKSG